jgi:hypothetical protein
VRGVQQLPECDQIFSQQAFARLNTARGDWPDDRRWLENGFLRTPLIQVLHCKTLAISDVTLKNPPFWTVNTVYCVGVVGVTAAREELAEELPAFLQRLREQTSLPLAVGFGISKRRHIEALRGIADAAIVGSAIIDVVESSPRDERVERVREYVEVLTGRTEASG